MKDPTIVRLHPLRVKADKLSCGENKLLPSIALSQSGAVLIISLIMLLLLTLIGASSMQTSSLEEKMAGNLRDRNLAFQAAESALRDAEQDIHGIGTTPRNPPISGISDFYHNCNMDSLANTYDDGLCDRKWTLPSSYAGTSINWPTFTNAATTYPALAVDMTTTPSDGKSVAYGRFTGAAPITGLSAQPRYIIEGYRGNANTYYRITARAQGASANTVVWLQAVYKQ
jgi:type IV pilus assembly protein PilX